MLETIIIFIIILLILVLSHEAGHFFSARFFGVKVEEFGFGIPPRIFGFRSKKGILYSLNLLPFGGFVKIFGEEGESVSDSESFGEKSAWIRGLILSAGIIANIALAYFIFSLLTAIGVPGKVTIENIASNSPAAEAGLKTGDFIDKLVAPNEEIMPRSMLHVSTFISQNAGKDIRIFVNRSGEKIEIVTHPRIDPPQGEGPLGVKLSETGIDRSVWYMVPIDGAKITWRVLKETFIGFSQILKLLLTREAGKIEVAGPIGIFGIVSSVRDSGFGTLLILMAILSISLAFINFLPIPGLDGGRLFFVLIEKAKGKRISPKISALFHTTGLLILIALMLLVTYQDLTRLFQS